MSKIANRSNERGFDVLAHPERITLIRRAVREPALLHAIESASPTSTQCRASGRGQSTIINDRRMSYSAELVLLEEQLRRSPQRGLVLIPRKVFPPFFSVSAPYKGI